jgi:hypothetical protein
MMVLWNLLQVTEKEYDDMFNVSESCNKFGPGHKLKLYFSQINSKIAFFFIQQALKNIEDGGSIVSIVTSL